MSHPPLPSTPHWHEIFGERIVSEIELPELAPAPPGEPRWSFTLDPSLPERPEGPLLGESPLYAEVVARLHAAPDGGRFIHVADTGLFHISADARAIRWRPNPEPWWDFGRGHLIGRVLATALHMDGVLTLHGSAVVLGGRAVAFLAPKFSGKSTLALALTRAGGLLLTDDSLPVEPSPDGGILARPGVHSVRLTAESREVLELAQDAELNREGKVVVRDPVPGRVARTPVPLAAVYFLFSTEPEPGLPPVTRMRAGGVGGALLLQGQTKVGEMLGGAEAPVLLDRCAEVVRRVPTWRLTVRRDFEVFDEVVETLLGWHPPDADG